MSTVHGPEPTAAVTPGIGHPDEDGGADETDALTPRGVMGSHGKVVAAAAAFVGAVALAVLGAVWFAHPSGPRWIDLPSISVAPADQGVIPADQGVAPEVPPLAPHPVAPPARSGKSPHRAPAPVPVNPPEPRNDSDIAIP